MENEILTRLNAGQSGTFDRYRDDPVGYARDVLKVGLTPDQELIARSLIEPPYKVLVQAGHNVGKSFLAAVLINWWYDCHNPSVCLTTAPTDRQVRDILWKEVRILRGTRGGFVGPKACRLQDSPDHFAHGFTSRDGNSFQGHHSPNVFIVFDEATGVDPIFWEAAETMLAGQRYAFLAIFNPTDITSHAFRACQSNNFRVFSMSCIDHPNIVAQEAGLTPSVPSAITIDRLSQLLEEWSEVIGDDEERLPTDVCVRGKWYRPGPVAEARLLGRWPAAGMNSVWSTQAFNTACTLDLPIIGNLECGVDVARFGDDATAVHVRRGGVSLFHHEGFGWTTVQTANFVEQVVYGFAQQYGFDARRVAVKVDDSGVGGGVVDIGRSRGWNFIGVNSGSKALDSDRYPNKRSELWFHLADAARRHDVSFRLLDADTLHNLRLQFLAPSYHLDSWGRRVVEPKSKTKERLGRSPDSADAVMLAYAACVPFERVVGTMEVVR